MTAPTTDSLERPDCQLSLTRRDAGTGRWVVLLHGAGADRHTFDPQLEALPADLGVVAWDARGHGESALAGPFRFSDMLADLDALVADLRPAELTLVGHSMGGNLAQSWAAAHPDRVDRLVLVDCTDNHGPLTRTERLLTRLAPAILRAYPWRTLVAQSAAGSGAEPATVAYVRDTLTRMGRSRFLEVMRFGADVLTPDPAYRLPCPTLAIVGEADRTGNIRAALARLAQRDPAVTLAVVPGASHVATLDRPEAVNDLLLHHLHEGNPA